MATNALSTAVDEILNDPSESSFLGLDSSAAGKKSKKKKQKEKKLDGSEKKVKKAKKAKKSKSANRSPIHSSTLVAHEWETGFEASVSNGDFATTLPVRGSRKGSTYGESHTNGGLQDMQLPGNPFAVSSSKWHDFDAKPAALPDVSITEDYETPLQTHMINTINTINEQEARHGYSGALSAISDDVSGKLSNDLSRGMSEPEDEEGATHDLLVEYMISMGADVRTAEELAFSFMAQQGVYTGGQPVKPNIERSPIRPPSTYSTSKAMEIQEMERRQNRPSSSDAKNKSMEIQNLERNRIRPPSTNATSKGMEIRNIQASLASASQSPVQQYELSIRREDIENGIISEPSPQVLPVCKAVEVQETDEDWPVIYAESTKIGVKDLVRQRPVMCIVVIALLLLIGGIVGIAIHLTRPKDVDAVIETSAPSMAPSSSPTLIADDIMLAAVELSGTASLLDPSSPQFRAVGWMSTYDSLDTVRFDSAFAQRYAMVVLYYSLFGEEWTNSEKWLDPGLHECDWSSGIICSDGSAEARVLTALDATRNNLQGTIPAEIGVLTQMQALRIPKNMVRGTIPLTIGQMTSLTSLDFSSNEIDGAIPTTIGRAQRLVSVDFAENRLNSTLPTELFSLKLLQSLVLASNNLTGSLAEELQELQSLVTLNLGNNKLTGTLPLSLDSISSLDFLYLDRNQMTGLLPYITKALVGMQVISLAYNGFNGNLALSPTFPANISIDDFSLQHIDISYNDLSGPISSIFGFLPTMRYFDLSGNKFVGTFPTNIGWEGIEHLAGAANALTGTIPIGYPTLSK